MHTFPPKPFLDYRNSLSHSMIFLGKNGLCVNQNMFFWSDISRFDILLVVGQFNNFRQISSLHRIIVVCLSRFFSRHPCHPIFLDFEIYHEVPEAILFS
mmetsp:Transcript_8071/g.10117  ORF Transcript_8071/g.10117 Transcript_8071/m.10117 type:complete len:99 (-) Transcript_8071:77-373(-)